MNRLFRKIVCAVLGAAVLAVSSGCGSSANHAGMEGLQMPKEADFAFGTTKYSQNAQVGGHDPCMIKDAKSGYYYAYSTDNSVDNTKPGKGIQIRRSKDLVNWEFVGVALSEKAILQAQDNGANAEPVGTFWAPCVRCVDGQYRLYYAATKAFGSSESRIWMAISASPEGPFENTGVAVSSWVEDGAPTGPNAIDPEIVNTPEGKTYMVYGSFFGGIFVKELKADGMPVNTDRKSADYFGTCVANKGGSAIDGPEGSSILYNKDTGYYYLFLSYGWLGDNYDIRVGRSKTVTGPYVDYAGHNMTENTKGLTTGTKLASSYCFTAAKPGGKQQYTNDDWAWGGFRGPGHGAPYQDGNDFYFIHHIRDGAECYKTESEGKTSYNMHYMMVRKMYFVDGWPVLSPERFAGEKEQKISTSTLAGSWECISFTSFDNSQETSLKAQLSAFGSDGTGKLELDGKNGSWSYDENQNLLTLKLPDGSTLHAKAEICWDLENSKAAVCFTGLSSDGTAWWGKTTTESKS